MTKDKKKKKKAKAEENDMVQEEGEGIPLKMANEYRRTNRMGLLTPEQFEARKAVIRANNQKAEEAVMGKRVKSSNLIRPEYTIKHPEHFKHPEFVELPELFRCAIATKSKQCFKGRSRKDRS